MFVRKLQTICILLILVVLVKTSTTDLVIANDTKNFTNVANTTAEISHSGGYPIHQVSTMVRGWLIPIRYLHIHWVDWTGQSKWYETINTEGRDLLQITESTSPPWAVGYYYDLASFYGNGPTSPIFWWDGWVNGIFCNDLHFYIKHVFTYVLSSKLDIISGGDCSYPFP